MYNFCLQFEFKLLSFAHSIPFYFHFIFRFCHKFFFPHSISWPKYWDSILLFKIYFAEITF